MKKILITGKNSYIGTSFEKYLRQWPENYQVETISVRGEDWKQHDFSQYDTILHLAGIAHVSTDPNMADLYYEVNRDLTIAVAEKAKQEKVQQFIFMSSMIVFGKPENGIVTKNTKPNPENFYGRSKLEAEVGLHQLEADDFNIAIIRPPMIYGPNSKGNYPRLAKLAKITPIFPDYPNRRSMLFIDNLSDFLKEITDENKKGTFHPQNNDYVQTSKLVQEIGKVHNRKIYLMKLFNPIIKLLINMDLFNKVFGSLYYEKSEKLNKKEFLESIKATEVHNNDL